MARSRRGIITIIALLFFFTGINTLSLSAQNAGEIRSAGESVEQRVLSEKKDAPCISSECHSQMGKKKYIHKTGLLKDRLDPKACETCHEIIQPDELGVVREPQKTAGRCLHRFRKIPEKTADLCVKCHDTNSETPSSVLLTPQKIVFAGENMHWHKPFAEGKCTLCHDAHESDFFDLMKAQYPETPYAAYSADAYRLCFLNQCHQDLQNDLEIPRVLSGTGFRNGNLNLHYKHVNKNKGRTCRTCHRLHGSRFPDLMTGSFVFGTRELKLEYEQTDTGGSCKTPCHSTGNYDRYEPALNTINSSPTPGRDATKEELEKSRIEEQNAQLPQDQ